MRVVAAVLVWISAAAGAGGVASVVTGSIHPTLSSAATGTGAAAASAGSAAPAAPFDASSVTATDPDSLFVTKNFAKALSAVQTRIGTRARVSNVALYPGYLDMTEDKGGVEVDVYIDAVGNITVTNTGANTAGDTSFALTKVAAAAPATLAQRIAAGAHVPESELRYMVADMDPPPPGVEWLVYTSPGSKVSYFDSAGPTGRMVEYLSNNTGPFPVR